MFAIFGGVVGEAPPIAAVAMIVSGVLAQFNMGHDAAAAESGWGKRQYFERSLANGLSIARCAMWPDKVKELLWWRLAPIFNVKVKQGDDPVIEQRLVDLEAENAALKRDRDDDRKRLEKLEALMGVRKSA